MAYSIDEEFFKDNRFLRPLIKAPYFAARVRPSGYGTVGGIRVNDNCDTMNYEEMIDFVAEAGLECVEVACWPAGKAERRYAGVSHIDVDRVLSDDSYAQHILSYAADHGVQISSLAFYPNTMDADLAKRAAAVEHIMKLIKAFEGSVEDVKKSVILSARYLRNFVI